MTQTQPSPRQTSQLQTPRGDWPRHLSEAVDSYLAVLRQTLGTELLAVTLSPRMPPAAGAAVRSVVVLERVDLGSLERLARQGADFGRAQIAPPQILTAALIRESLDTFPLELLEIQQDQATLWGQDYFAALSFEARFVRLQCERELKVLLIGAHRRALAGGADPQRLSGLTLDMLADLMRVLRGLAWLVNSTATHTADELLPRVEDRLARPLPGVRHALEGRKLGRDFVELNAWRLFGEIYEDLQALASFADRWQ